MSYAGQVTKYSLRSIIGDVFDFLFAMFDHSFYLKTSANIKKISHM